MPFFFFFGCSPPGKEDFKQSSGAIGGLVWETMLLRVFYLLPWDGSGCLRRQPGIPEQHPQAGVKKG